MNQHLLSVYEVAGDAAWARSQYLANEPGAPLARSRFFNLIPRAVAYILTAPASV